MAITNATLAQKVSDLLDYWIGFATEYANWLGGSVGGGAGLDGKYPLTDYAGTESLVKCPAQLEDDVTGIVSSATTQANAASASAAAASTSADTATTQAGLADSSRISAETAQAAAELAEDGAATSAATALAQATSVIAGQLPTATTVQLADIAHSINTANAKVAGQAVFNTTTGKPVFALGALDGSLWVDATGATAHTPI